MDTSIIQQLTVEQSTNKKGRSKKYATEEDRKKAIQESWRKAQNKRREVVLEYVKEWRNNNRDRVNELNRKYTRQKKNIEILTELPLVD